MPWEISHAEAMNSYYGTMHGSLRENHWLFPAAASYEAQGQTKHTDGRRHDNCVPPETARQCVTSPGGSVIQCHPRPHPAWTVNVATEHKNHASVSLAMKPVQKADILQTTQYRSSVNWKILKILLEMFLKWVGHFMHLFQIHCVPFFCTEVKHSSSKFMHMCRGCLYEHVNSHFTQNRPVGGFPTSS